MENPKIFTKQLKLSEIKDILIDQIIHIAYYEYLALSDDKYSVIIANEDLIRISDDLLWYINGQLSSYIQVILAINNDINPEKVVAKTIIRYLTMMNLECSIIKKDKRFIVCTPTKNYKINSIYDIILTDTHVVSLTNFLKTPNFR